MEEQHYINDKPAIMCLSKDMILLIASLLDEQDLANWAHSCQPFYLRLYDYRVAKLKRHRTITAINAGFSHSLFARHHTLYASGDNGFGQLGLGDTEHRQHFEHVKALPSPVIKLAAGYYHSLVVLKNGELWACGYNKYGQLGLGDTQKRQRLEPVKGLPSSVIKIAVGSVHSLVVLKNGELWACGDNDFGQLGLGDNEHRQRFGRIKGLPSPVIKLAAGRYHSLVLLKNGELWACGYNNFGQLGLGDTEHRQHFERVKGLPSPVIKLAAGDTHSLVLLKNEALWACGYNNVGQLGLGDTQKRQRFERINGLPSPVIMLSGGSFHTLVVLKNAELWACGNNTQGHLGLGDTEHRQHFERVKLLPSPVIKITAGHSHSLVLLKNSDLWACGRNNYGQLGLGSKSKSMVTRFVKITSSKIPAMMRLFTNNLRTINYAALNHLLEDALSLLAIEHSPHQKTLLVKKLLADCQRCDWRLIDDTLRQDVDQLSPDNLKDFYKKCRRLLNEETSQASTHDNNRAMRK